LVTATLLTLVVLPALYTRFGSADPALPGEAESESALEPAARNEVQAPRPVPVK
jgi:hypothetical protein